MARKGQRTGIFDLEDVTEAIQLQSFEGTFKEEDDIMGKYCGRCALKWGLEKKKYSSRMRWVFFCFRHSSVSELKSFAPF